MKSINYFLMLIILLSGASCFSPADQAAKSVIRADWRSQLDDQLQLLGHRNWILVVDKAFPQQNAPGIVTINTGEKLLPVLQHTLTLISQSTHVKPIVFTDAELNYITEKQVPEIETFKTELFSLIPKEKTQTLLHDSVFVQIAKASELFRIVVLKTEQVIPYSSVFLQLDCKYWSADDEQLLRESMPK